MALKPKIKKSPGRPATGFDKSAYMRQYMRDRRAKAKKALTEKA